MTTPISILLVDDHALFLESFGQRLEAEPEFKVVGSAQNAQEAVDMIGRCPADIVLMDISMPGLICFNAAKRIMKKCRSARIIFLSGYFNDHYIEQAIKVKARGYLTKSEPPQRVVAAIKQVAGGRVCFSPQVRDRIVAGGPSGPQLDRPEKTRVSTLTERELEVLRYITRGLSKKEMSETMHLSIKTIEGHTDRLMNKLDIHDRVELARFAIREGLAEA